MLKSTWQEVVHAGAMSWLYAPPYDTCVSTAAVPVGTAGGLVGTVAGVALVGNVRLKGSLRVKGQGQPDVR